MLIDVRTHGFEATDAIVQHAQERVGSALGPASGRVTRVTVRVDDINGDHGGEDKLCRIMARLRSMPEGIVEAVHRDLYAALDHAADKLKAALGRKIGRRGVAQRERVTPLRRLAFG